MSSGSSASASKIQIVRPARSLRGSLILPGDKSISHRYAMLAGFANGTSRLTNFSTGADPHSSLACMQAMGAKVEFDGKVISVTGTGGVLQHPKGDLDCGNSGSTMRMLAGLVAAIAGVSTGLSCAQAPAPVGSATAGTEAVGAWEANAAKMEFRILDQ